MKKFTNDGEINGEILDQTRSNRFLNIQASPPRLAAQRSGTIWPAHKFLEPYNRTAKEFLFSLRDGLVTMEYPPWLASRHDTSPKPVIRK